MSAAVTKPPTPTLALSVEQRRTRRFMHIEPDLRVVRIGRRKLIAVSELQRWLDEHAEAVA